MKSTLPLAAALFLIAIECAPAVVLTETSYYIGSVMTATVGEEILVIGLTSRPYKATQPKI